MRAGRCVFCGVSARRTSIEDFSGRISVVQAWKRLAKSSTTETGWNSRERVPFGWISYHFPARCPSSALQLPLSFQFAPFRSHWPLKCIHLSVSFDLLIEFVAFHLIFTEIRVASIYIVSKASLNWVCVRVCVGGCACLFKQCQREWAKETSFAWCVTKTKARSNETR